MDVHTRCKPQSYLKQFHFMSDHFSYFFDKLQIPCLGKKGSHGNRGTVLVIGSSSFFTFRCKKSAFQRFQKITGFNFSFEYLIGLFQTNAGGAIRKHEAGHIPGIHSCCGNRLSCCTRNGLSCRTKLTLSGINISCCKGNKLIQRQAFGNFSRFTREFIRNTGIRNGFCLNIGSLQFRCRKLICHLMPCSFFFLHF